MFSRFRFFKHRALVLICLLPILAVFSRAQTDPGTGGASPPATIPITPSVPVIGVDFHPATGKFLNLSTRGWVEGTSKPLIAGLVVSTGDRAVLIRAVGPSLVDYGVTDFLPRPHLALHDSDGKLVTQTGPWSVLSDGQKSEAIRLAQKTGAFPLKESSDDAVLMLFLPAGIYTCIVTGQDGSSGTALVECYDIPPVLIMTSMPPVVPSS